MASWSELLPEIGVPEVNKELDERTKLIFDGLRHLASLCRRDNDLIQRVKAQSVEWLPARDQYLRSILHLAAFQGNTRLVKCLVYAGAEVNLDDGIGQTPLTLALHKGHDATSTFLINNGATVQEEYFTCTVCPLSIAINKNSSHMVEVIKNKLSEEKCMNDKLSANFAKLNEGTRQWKLTTLL